MVKQVKPAENSTRRAYGVERSSARRTQWLRLTRTIGLGSLAVVAAIFWLGDQYGIEREATLEFLGTSLLFVFLLAAAGLAGAALLLGVRKLTQRKP